jgi:hypothetical protein
VARDFQRKKVYEAESFAFDLLAATRRSSHGPYADADADLSNLDRCREYVDEVLTSEAWLSLGVDLEQPPQVESGRALRACLAIYPQVIWLPEHYRRRRVIVHELSHLAVAYLYDRYFNQDRGSFHFRAMYAEAAHHGAEFTGINLHLVRGLFGEHAYEILRRSYEERRAKVLPFVPRCRVCSSELTPERSTRRYCSDSCRYVHHTRKRRSAKAPRRRHACQQCGRDFLAARVDAKTCSPKCRQKAYRQRGSNACG